MYGTVAELKEALGLGHTTAHEYCRDLHAADLLERKGRKIARYGRVEFYLQAKTLLELLWKRFTGDVRC